MGINVSIVNVNINTNIGINVKDIITLKASTPTFWDSIFRKRSFSQKHRLLSGNELFDFYKDEKPLVFYLSVTKSPYVVPASFCLEPVENGILKKQEMDLDFKNTEAVLSKSLDEYALTLKKKADRNKHIYNGPNNLKLIKIDLKKKTAYLQKSPYYNTLLTNFTPDYKPKTLSLTVREKLQGNGKLGAFSNNKFGNHIGIVAMIETSEGLLVSQKRSGKVANRSGTISASSSGTLEIQDIDFSATENSFFIMLQRGLQREVEEELGLDIMSKGNEIYFLGGLRDWERAGMADFYFYIKTDKSFKDIQEGHRLVAEEKHESDKIIGYEFYSEHVNSNNGKTAHDFKLRIHDMLFKKVKKTNLTFFAGVLLASSNILQRTNNLP